jgi:integrase
MICGIRPGEIIGLQLDDLNGKSLIVEAGIYRGKVDTIAVEMLRVGGIHHCYDRRTA